MKYIYLLIDPLSSVVRYVGASKNPKSRYRQHIRDAVSKSKKGKPTIKQQWIQGLIALGLQPRLKIIAKTEDDKKARALEEKTVIKHINTVYNLHMPGKGSLSVKHFKKTGKIK